MTAPRRPTPTLLNELQDSLILPGMLRFTKLGFAWRKRYWLMVSMHGRTVVVAGATSGRGEAAARQFAALGARVVIVGRSREKAEPSRKMIVAARGNEWKRQRWRSRSPT